MFQYLFQEKHKKEGRDFYFFWRLIITERRLKGLQSLRHAKLRLLWQESAPDGFQGLDSVVWSETGIIPVSTKAGTTVATCSRQCDLSIMFRHCKSLSMLQLGLYFTSRSEISVTAIKMERQIYLDLWFVKNDISISIFISARVQIPNVL